MANKELYDLKKRVQTALRCCDGSGACEARCPYGGMERCRDMLRIDANHIINSLWTDNKRLRKRLAAAMAEKTETPSAR